ncbi:hypothetical protein B5X24_HaOG212990 [Helicoverpa armigera]|nr:hypothetical protein B5X24_HaOG212990 [Helicoverpa armigera]
MSKPADLGNLAPTLGATVLVSRQSAPAPPHAPRSVPSSPTTCTRHCARAHSPAANTRVSNEYSQITNNPTAKSLVSVINKSGHSGQVSTENF